jgi:cysteinyl-tRNA synthetase
VRPEDVPSVLGEPAGPGWSIHWLHEGWAEDVLRGIAALDRHRGPRHLHHVVVEAVPAPRGTWPRDVEVVPLVEGTGFGDARNAGLRRSRGTLVAVVDGSVEPAGDVLGPLEEALAGPDVGVVGPVGVVTDDLHEFREAPGPEVDAIEGYLMAFRRRVLERGAAFDPRFRFYRAADLDLSFRIRDLGLRAVRVDVPMARHEHRGWASLPEARRARLSKRNFYRFLDRWRGRTDLLVGGR